MTAVAETFALITIEKKLPEYSANKKFYSCYFLYTYVHVIFMINKIYFLTRLCGKRSH